MDSELDSSVKPSFAGQRSNEVVECQKTEGIGDQRPATGRRNLSVGGRPVGPFARHGKRAQLRMAQAQSLDARNSSDLQNNKPVAAKRMKRMGYLSRSQRLTGSKCSSM
jgi:hypothetical protein